MKKGLFITIEGGEGAGKSTALSTLQSFISDTGRDVVITREPGGTALGERLRELLLHSSDLEIVADSELLMIFAARAQHIATVIRPALNANKVVLCDRFTDASFAYQGGGRGIAVSRIAQLEQWVQGELRPDLTLLFDIDVEQGLRRAGQRSDPDRFEREQVTFFEQVRQAYLAIADLQPDRVKIIDASQDINSVNQQLRQMIQGYI